MILALALADLFPESRAPYTLLDITSYVEATLDHSVTYGRVYRAYRFMVQDAATTDLVQPIASRARVLHFSADAARRIARRALSRRAKEIIQAKRQLNRN